MRLFHRFRAILAVLTLAASFSLVAVDFAEARRGGSFGSRGGRTFDAPAATRTAPTPTRPVDQTMTPRQQTTQPGAQNQAARPGQAAAARQNRGPFGGMMGGILGGLMLGGLIGLLLGGGLGGLAGFFGLLLQVGLIVLVIWLVMRFIRSRRQPQPAYAGGYSPRESDEQTFGSGRTPYQAASTAGPAYDAAPAQAASAPMGGNDEIGLTADDYDSFEQLLHEVQAAFTREDFAALRERATAEIVSFLSEELSQNAVRGVRNEVRDVQLLQGDLAEAWREGDQEYATVAMRYESVDVMRDRQTGAIVEGKEEPTETTEIWTFVRPVGGRWKLSAIQQA